jgi:hypothetical protein
MRIAFFLSICCLYCVRLTAQPTASHIYYLDFKQKKTISAVRNDTLEAGSNLIFMLQKTEKGCADPAFLRIEIDNEPLSSSTGSMFITDVPSHDFILTVKCQEELQWKDKFKVKGGNQKASKKAGASASANNNTPVYIRTEPVKDALRIDSLLKYNDLNAAAAILKSYQFDRADFTAISFLSGYPALLEKFPVARTMLEPNGLFTNSFPPLLNLLDPTQLINAIVKVGADHFKQELTIGYLNRFRDSLMTNYPDLQTLLPGTYDVLLHDDFFNFPVFISSIRQNGAKDIQDFPRNGQAYLQENLSKMDPVTYPAIMASLGLVQSTRIGMPAFEVLESLSQEDYILDNHQVFSESVKALTAFSRSLHTAQGLPTVTGWAGANEIQLLLSKPDAYNFWMAMLLKTQDSTLAHIQINSKSLYDLLNTQDKSIRPRKILLSFNQMGFSTQAIKPLTGDIGLDSITIAAYARYVDGMLGLVSSGLDLFASVKDPVTVALLDKEKSILYRTGRIADGIYTGQYGLAVAGLVGILNDAFVTNKSKLIYFLNEHGHFLVNLVEAQNSSQIAAAIDGAVMPVQSYRLKRRPGVKCITLNMYAGGSVGGEFSVDESGKKGLLLAPTMPIGVAFNWGKKNGSFTLFASAIDLGAVAAFRIQDDVSLLPELKWINVVAPGVHFLWGFKNSPLVLGLSGQLGPSLRQVTAQGITTDARQARVALTLAVDLPLLTFKQ